MKIDDLDMETRYKIGDKVAKNYPELGFRMDEKPEIAILFLLHKLDSIYEKIFEQVDFLGLPLMALDATLSAQNLNKDIYTLCRTFLSLQKSFLKSHNLFVKDLMKMRDPIFDELLKDKELLNEAGKVAYGFRAACDETLQKESKL